MRRLLAWIGWAIGSGLAVLVVATLATARFGDAALYPPQAASPQVEVLIVSHGYHAGIVLPRAAMVAVADERGLPALGAVAARFAAHPWLEFGWGDEGFYRSVPTAASLTLSMALLALLKPGNPTVLHVVGLIGAPRASFPNADMVALRLSERGFARLAAALDGTFARDPRDGGIEDLGPGLYGPSLFYRAVGTFSLFRVCNHWVADLLAAAGAPTAPVPATLPPGLLSDLSWRAGAVRLAPAAARQ